MILIPDPSHKATYTIMNTALAVSMNHVVLQSSTHKTVTPIKTILKNTKNCPHQLDPPPNRTHHTRPYQLSTNEQKVKINKHKKKHEIPTPKTQSLFSFAVFFLLQPTLKLSQHTYTNFQPSRTKNTAQGFVFVSLFDSLLSSLLPFHFGVQNLNPSPKILL